LESNNAGRDQEDIQSCKLGTNLCLETKEASLILSRIHIKSAC